MNLRKAQTVANITIAFSIIKKDGTQGTVAGGVTLASLSSKVVGPDGLAITGYTEATFTEPNADGTFIATFPSNAAVKAFITTNSDNPYYITFDSSITDYEPTPPIPVWIVSMNWYSLTVSIGQLLGYSTSTLQIFDGMTNLSAWMRYIFRKDTVNLDATAKTEINNGSGTYNEAVDSLEAISEQSSLIYSTVSNLGFSQRLQASLSTITLASSGDNYQQVVVLVTDVNDNLFDPADLTNPASGAGRIYNGVGSTFTDVSGNRVQMYADNIGTPLTDISLCHHIPQSNKPQTLKRLSTGIYYFWANATLTDNKLPLGQLKSIFGFFDISQSTATYATTGSYTIQDTDPSSHKRILYAVDVVSNAGIDTIIDKVDLLQSDIGDPSGEVAPSSLNNKLNTLLTGTTLTEADKSDIVSRVENSVILAKEVTSQEIRTQADMGRV